MEIDYFSLTKLRNEEHFQFHTENRDLIIKLTPVALGIESQYPTYNDQYNNENEALNFIKKNAVYPELVEAETNRESLYRGLSFLMKSSCLHFSPVIKQAALRVQVVFNEISDFTDKSYSEKTASINNLIWKLNQNFASDVTTLGITDWLTHLKSGNDSFDTLSNNRHSEEVAKTQLRMQKVRLELDSAYRKITKRINALIELNGDEDYKEFVKELNNRIDHYRNNLAIRLGKNSKDDSTDTTSSK
jgi:hypothetical protein